MPVKAAAATHREGSIYERSLISIRREGIARGALLPLSCALIVTFGEARRPEMPRCCLACKPLHVGVVSNNGAGQMLPTMGYLHLVMCVHLAK